MWTEVSSAVPHFLQVGLSLSPITYKCLLKVLCPVSRPITTLACVQLEDSNLAPVGRLGPEINSLASEAMRRCLKVTTAMFCNISSHRFINTYTLQQKPSPTSLGKMKRETKGLSETLQTIYKTTAKGNKRRQ